MKYINLKYRMKGGESKNCVGEAGDIRNCKEAGETAQCPEDSGCGTVTRQNGNRCWNGNTYGAVSSDNSNDPGWQNTWQVDGSCIYN